MSDLKSDSSIPNAINAKEKGWPDQDLTNLDISTLTPLSPVVMHRQATINIGTIGHVAHGKSTVVKAISGVQTVRFKTELERNITIKLGYANAKIFKCDNSKCPRPGNYKSYGSGKEANPKCERVGCEGKMVLQRHVSFVDCFDTNTQLLDATGNSISIKDLKQGTELMGVNGAIRTVKSIVKGQKQLYQISYSISNNNNNNSLVLSTNNNSFSCTGGHLLCLKMHNPIDEILYNPTNSTYSIQIFTADSNHLLQSTIYTFNSVADLQQFLSQQTIPEAIYFEMPVETYLSLDQSLKQRISLYFNESPLEFPQINNNHNNSVELSCETAYLLGLYLSPNNTINRENNLLAFTLSNNNNNNSQLLHRLTELADNLGYSVQISSNNNNNKDEIQVQFNHPIPNSPLSQLFTQILSSSSSSSSSVPQQIQFYSNPSIRQSFLHGFIQSLQYESLNQNKSLLQALISLSKSLGSSLVYNSTSKQYQLVNNSSLSLFFTVEASETDDFIGFEVDSADGIVYLDNYLTVHNCPGHDILMATMLNGAAVMDAAMLLIAGNETCPQPQTSEHLAAVEIMKLKHLLILQNKIDLVKEKEAAGQYEEILNFIRGTVADGSPIIPISAQLKYNIEVICEYICKKIPIPIRDFSAAPQLIVIRSFDVNKPGEEVDNLKGGVAGGSILKGVLKIGQEIEIRPGIVTKDKAGNVRCLPILSVVVSLYAEHNDLSFAVPGGLIGVGTKIDPTLTRADRLVGQVLGDAKSLPDIFAELEISFFLLRRLLGVKTDGDKKKQGKIKKLVKGEILMVNIGSTSTGARILQVKGDLAKVILTSPVCTSEGEKLALSRRVDKHWRLIGWGKIRKGTKIIQSSSSMDTSGLSLTSAASGSGDSMNELEKLNKEADEADDQENEEVEPAEEEENEEEAD